MDIPLIEALNSKLNMAVTPGHSTIGSNFGDSNLERLAKSFWLQNDTIAFDVDDEKFLIDPNNVDNDHVFTLLDLGFTVMHVMEYLPDEGLDGLNEARSVYGLVADTDGRRSTELMPKLVALLKTDDTASDARYIVTIHGIYGA